MHAVQMRLRIMADEELAAAGVLAAVSHRHHTRDMLVRIVFRFAGNCVAQIARAGAVRTAALGNEMRNDAVESLAVVIAFLDQLDEVGDGDRRFVRIQLKRNFRSVGHRNFTLN